MTYIKQIFETSLDDSFYRYNHPIPTYHAKTSTFDYSGKITDTLQNGRVKVIDGSVVMDLGVDNETVKIAKKKWSEVRNLNFGVATISFGGSLAISYISTHSKSNFDQTIYSIATVILGLEVIAGIYRGIKAWYHKNEWNQDPTNAAIIERKKIGDSLNYGYSYLYEKDLKGLIATPEEAKERFDDQINAFTTKYDEDIKDNTEYSAKNDYFDKFFQLWPITQKKVKYCHLDGSIPLRIQKATSVSENAMKIYKLLTKNQEIKMQLLDKKIEQLENSYENSKLVTNIYTDVVKDSNSISINLATEKALTILDAKENAEIVEVLNSDSDDKSQEINDIRIKYERKRKKIKKEKKFDKSVTNTIVDTAGFLTNAILNTSKNEEVKKLQKEKQDLELKHQFTLVQTCQKEIEEILKTLHERS